MQRNNMIVTGAIATILGCFVAITLMAAHAPKRVQGPMWEQRLEEYCIVVDNYARCFDLTRYPAVELMPEGDETPPMVREEDFDIETTWRRDR